VTRRIFLLAAVRADDLAGKVVVITDGDTVCVMHDGASERIRLRGPKTGGFRWNGGSMELQGGMSYYDLAGSM
jgi:hypothetical protein